MLALVIAFTFAIVAICSYNIGLDVQRARCTLARYDHFHYPTSDERWDA